MGSPKKETTLGRKIIGRLQDFKAALESNEIISEQFNCRKVELDLKPTHYSPALVKQTREILKASQTIFSRFLGVSTNAVRSWEQGSNPPSEIACRFMDEIRNDPDYWRKRLKECTVLKPVGKS